MSFCCSVYSGPCYYITIISFPLREMMFTIRQSLLSFLAILVSLKFFPLPHTFYIFFFFFCLVHAISAPYQGTIIIKRILGFLRKTYANNIIVYWLWVERVSITFPVPRNSIKMGIESKNTFAFKRKLD